MQSVVTSYIGDSKHTKQLKSKNSLMMTFIFFNFLHSTDSFFLTIKKIFKMPRHQLSMCRSEWNFNYFSNLLNTLHPPVLTF